MINASFGEFPTALRGNTEQARRNWQRIATAAWESGSWEQALDGEDWSSIFADQNPIICKNDSRRVYSTGESDIWISSNPAWHLNLIMECLPTDYNQLCTEWRRHFQLVKQALSYPWWCCGLVQGNPVCFPFLGIISSQQYGAGDDPFMDCRYVAGLIVKAFVNWLPDLYKLEHRFAVARMSRGLESATLASRLGMIIDLAVTDRKFERSAANALFLSSDSRQIIDRLREYYGY